MSEDRPVFRWTVLGGSVRGASHFRTDLPNQDAIGFLPDPGSAAPVVLAVSDGHGSPKSFRSDLGAKLAVRVAKKIVSMFLERMKGQSTSVVKDAAQQRLPADLVKAWKEIVGVHFKDNPFTEKELKRVETEVGPAGVQAVTSEGQFLVAYGATLLLVAVTEGFVFYLQLGDGDILTVSDRTGQVEPPLARDPTLIANETTSLCMADAQRQFCFRFQPIQADPPPPALILVSTDGYSNSFSSDADFLRVGTDLLQLLRTDGPEQVQGHLDSWLNEASSVGSGDDVTLGIICRLDAIERAAGDPTASATEGSASDQSLGSAQKNAKTAVVDPGNPTTSVTPRVPIAPEGMSTTNDLAAPAAPSDITENKAPS